MQASLASLANNRRFVEIGEADIEANERLPLVPFAGDISFSLFSLSKMTEASTSRLLTAVMDLFVQKKISPQQPLLVRGVSEIEQTFRHMQSGRSIGKTVLSFAGDEVVAVRERARNQSAADCS